MDSLIELLESPQLAASLLLVVPIILGLVQAIKKALRWSDDQDRFKPLVSIAIGVVLMTAMQIAQKFPTIGEWIIVAIVGGVLGLAASGLYTIQKVARNG